MTRNQILYQELQQTKRRDQVNAEVARANLEIERGKLDVSNRSLTETSRHNMAMEGETQRHNIATENETRRYNSLNLEEVKRHNTTVEMETNRHNLAMEGFELQGLQIKQFEAETGRMNADTNRMNANINAKNAESNRMQAQAAQTSAAAAYQNAQTNMRMADIQESRNKWEEEVARKDAESRRITAQAESDYKYVMQENAGLQATAYYYQMDAAMKNAETNSRNATTNEKRLALDKILANSQVDLNRALSDQAYANAAYSKIRTAYYDDENTREWVNTAFNGWNAFSNFWKSVAGGRAGTEALAAMLG